MKSEVSPDWFRRHMRHPRAYRDVVRARGSWVSGSGLGASSGKPRPMMRAAPRRRGRGRSGPPWVRKSGSRRMAIAAAPARRRARPRPSTAATLPRTPRRSSPTRGFWTPAPAARPGSAPREDRRWRGVPRRDRARHLAEPDARYLCIEPWHRIADPVGYEGDVRDKPGVALLQPGESGRFGMDVSLPAG